MSRVILRSLFYLAAFFLAWSCFGAETNFEASLTADFAARDAMPESRVPKSEWATKTNWGPAAAAYPPVEAPAGVDPVKWKRERVVAVAKKYIGLPYRHHHIPDWEPAGDVPDAEKGRGLDCSNFSAWVYNYGLGVKFTSDVQDQANGKHAPGRVLAKDEAFEPGDLLFIEKMDRSEISHVVIFVDAEHIIDCHASGVAVRKFKGWYKSHLVLARRVIE
jgi:cell wall-associated NlpC family hydrolase